MKQPTEIALRGGLYLQRRAKLNGGGKHRAIRGVEEEQSLRKQRNYSTR